MSEDMISEDELLDARLDVISVVEHLGKGTDLLGKAIREFQDGHNYVSKVAAKCAVTSFLDAAQTLSGMSEGILKWVEYLESK